MLRDVALTAFLNRTGFGDRTPSMLAGDASNRRYLRLDGEPRNVVMDAPPEKGEDVRPFVQMTNLLRDFGYSAPDITAADVEQGFLVLEDLGDDLFARVVGRMAESTLYEAAVDLLVNLHSRAAPNNLAPYDLDVYLREAHLLTEWYLPATDRSASADTIAQFDEAIRSIYASVKPKVLVLRDYHSENLLWLPDRAGHARVGLLDYQDALIGHPAYDLVSLLEDARRDTSPELRDAMVSRYMTATGVDHAEFKAAYASLGAQRNIKILGLFARLWLRDGKSHYLDLMPRVWAHLQNDLAHPALAELRAWIAAHVPAPSDDVRAAMRQAA